MYTVVPKPEIVQPKLLPGDPKPLIIDHRENIKRTYKRTNDEKERERDRVIRNAYVEAEAKYKHRIEELEKENRDLIKAYEPTYQENKILKNHFERGPEVMKLRKLQKEKKDLTNELELVKEENELLHQRIKELERMLQLEKNYYLQEKWDQALTRGRKKLKSQNSVQGTQGPFQNPPKVVKRKFLEVKDEDFETKDENDIILDKLEEKTQTLLNEISGVKQHKRNIDYVKFVGKGAVTRNQSIADAFSQKLEHDIEAFAMKLEKLRLKARSLKAESSENSSEKVKNKRPGGAPNVTSKYFRTKEIQTESGTSDGADQSEEGLILQKEDERKRSSSSKSSSGQTKVKNPPSAKESEKIAQENKSGTSSAKSSQERNSEQKHRTDDRNATLKQKKTHNSSSLNDDELTPVVNTESKVRTKENKITMNSPIQDHWDYLAEKLAKTEKQKITTQRSVQKVYGLEKGSNKNSEKIVSRNREPNRSSTPKTDVKFLEELPREQISPVLPNTVTRNQDTRKAQSPKKKNNGSGETNDKVTNSKPGTSERLTSRTTLKSPRKTTNTGPTIGYVEKQHSWETFTTPRQYNYIEQSGRYSNGPEPVGWRKKPARDLNSSRKFKSEEKLKQSDLKTREESSKKQDSAKGNERKLMLTASTDRPSERRVSEYDLVLADMKKQYQQHAGYLHLKPATHSSTTRKSEAARSTEVQTNDVEQLPDFKQVLDFKSNGRTFNSKEERSIMGNSGLRQERLYHLDLL